VSKLKEDGLDLPIVGFGHSMGGAVVYAAAARSPESFSFVSLFDPPMFRPSIRAAMLLLNLTGLFHFHPLVQATKRRPASFATVEDAHEFIKSRRLYGTLFHPEVLEAFLEHGLVQQTGAVATGGSGVAFAFSPEAEAMFYRSTPTDLLHSWLRPSVLPSLSWIGQYDTAHCPGELIFSSRHDFNSKANVDYLRGVLRCYNDSHDPATSTTSSPGTTPFRFIGEDVNHFHPLIDPREMATWITTTDEDHDH
jgi:pimeloyl-ACP methyl ester carboxylesterase